MRPIAPPVLLLVGFVSEGSEVSLKCTNQPEIQVNLGYKTYVEEGELSEPVLWVLPGVLLR